MNRRTLVGAVLVAAIAATAYVHGQLSATAVTIDGRVTDATGAPVPGLQVELTFDGKPLRSATTDGAGRFRFENLEPDTERYEVRMPVPGRADARVRLPTGSTAATVRAGNYTLEIRARRIGARGPTASPRPSPPPPPTPPVSLPKEIPPETAPPGADPDNHTIVPVFYATDRNRISYTPVAYGGEREPANRLHLGRIDVSVPRDHQMGQLERPTIWTLWKEDPNKHFVIVRGVELTYDAFYGGVSDAVKQSRRKEAFVFVHGFNVTFESAVYRTAQIAYDLTFDGAPILYSWPSRGTALGYPVDLNNSEWTTDHLHWFLEDVAARSGAEQVHVIAHSRGNGPVMNALKAIATEERSHERPRFSQLILTAPDVDADGFRLLARAFRALADRTTLYASSNDDALALSKKYQGYQRAGDVRPQIVVVDGVDSIDVSDVDTSFLGHSYYGDNTSVISDIRRLVQTGSPPPSRCGIQAVSDALVRYWKFVARATCPTSGTH